MLEKLRLVENRYLELEDMSGRPDFYNDPAKAASLLKEQRNLEPVVTAYRRYMAEKQNMEELLELLSGTLEPDFREMCQEELEEAKELLPRLEQELKILLLPKDPNDEKNVILEIRAGTGGDEAALFGMDLLRMYTRYAERNRFKVEYLSSAYTEMGGVKEVVLNISGKGAFSCLKYESGVHRVQRVPETESQGRIHTSAATVAVLPEAEDVDVKVDPADLRIDVYRASGNGGQCVNTTDSAVRITHVPTGLVVTCQDEKSQLKNKEKCMKVLKSRLYDMAREEQEREYAENRRSQVGTGDRSERIRTYNFPQGRVTDHRIGLTIYKLEAFLDGDMEEVLGALQLAEKEAHFKAQEN